MSTTFQITPELALVQYLEFSKTKDSLLTEPFAAPTNRLFIYDRSGSMSWVIRKLVEDVYRWATSVKTGDTISIAYFSSPGQYKFVAKGVVSGATQWKEVLSSILQANNTTLATTCFSEVLGEVRAVISDLHAYSPNFSLMFFTDGCPVVPDVQAEEKEIRRVLAGLKAQLSSSLWIGYGDYYNKALMADMAEWSGGMLVHASNADRAAVEMANFTASNYTARPCLVYDLAKETPPLAAFVVDGDGVSRVSSNSAVSVPEGGAAWGVVKQTSNGVDPITDPTPIYAAAVALSQGNQTDVALEMLGALGDKHLATKLANAYTAAEIGTVETELRQAITTEQVRFLGGKLPGCVPAKNVFCVIDALELLAADPLAYFYPRHPNFSYKRIGAAAHNKEGFAKFEASADSHSSFSSLVWNDKRMNVGIRTLLRGTVELQPGFEKFGLAQKFPTTAWREYVIVKDGILNTAKLPCTMSGATYAKFCDEGMINCQTPPEWGASEIYTVDLTVLPVMNRAMADGKTSAQELFENAWQELQLEAKLKALRYYLKEAGVEEEPSLLSAEATAWLKEQGLTDKGYSPKTEAAPTGDSYTALTFEIVAAGYSGLPKVSEVEERAAKGVKQTKPGELVLVGIKDYEKLAKRTNAELLPDALAQRIAKETAKLKEVRTAIQHTKFAVLLGNRWFDEFKSRELKDCTLTVEGVEFGLRLKPIIVTI